MVGGFVFDPWVVSGGTSYSMADEAFVVPNMFGVLGGEEIDLIHVHSHRVFDGLLGSRVGGSISLSTPQFLHS